ncbi:MAG TPA: class I SAM-dependent methyltransferase [Jiangellaceae bacterium]|nr:class I SAM-dependent methyltransferase [Jiangellaceae bacterium]
MRHDRRRRRGKPERATLARSVRLFRAFLKEQSDPEYFYQAIAADSVDQIRTFAPVAGATVLDVGGGPGYFRAAFVSAGARYVSVDSDLGELASRGRPEPGSVVGSGLALPIRSGTVDICYSSNVLEHVTRPWQMAEEMLRVTRPGGLVYCSFTIWLSPWGGHETSPWHYLGGARAARRYYRKHGRPPKNVFGRSLFAVSTADALRWARYTPNGELLAAFPRYHPRWSHWVVRLPVVREFATWNLALVLVRR